MATKPNKNDAQKAKEKAADLTSGVTEDGTFKQQGETVVKEAFGVTIVTNY